MPESKKVPLVVYNLSEEKSVIFTRANNRLIQVADVESFHLDLHADGCQVFLYQCGGLGQFRSVARRNRKFQNFHHLLFIFGKSFLQKSALAYLPSVFSQITFYFL